jgi:hypothetical protein
MLRVSPVELQVFRVNALLAEFKEERDRDIHMVLQDPLNSALTVVAEIPSLSCVGACESSFQRRFKKARETLAEAYGEPTGSLRRILPPRRMVVTGSDSSISFMASVAWHRMGLSFIRSWRSDSRTID